MNRETKNPEAIAPRQHWLAVLAKAEESELEAGWDSLEHKPDYELLRRPEAGMVMVRARAGNTGVRFNLGEMTVTRCTVRISSGEVGFGYVAGRKSRHAELTALFDALLQRTGGEVSGLVESLVEPLHKAQQERKAKRLTSVAATRVDFSTLVRGEDG